MKLSPEQRACADAVFTSALDIDPAARSQYLDSACRDPQVRALVDDLLRLAETPDSRIVSNAGLRGPLIDLTAIADADAVGQQIGAYRIVRELGAGGMGVVHLAERADGHFEQQVALKVVRSGFENREARSRFEQERQILSRLSHPNIARLLDGGVSESGQPFYAMEYVDGEAIDDYCDRRSLTVTERLELVVTVAGAVLYAHRNLVVHRDLKPSNILVSAAGEIKLVDFGIAKLLDSEATAGGGRFTETVGRAMTPQYASPEQVRGEPITIASDVYQLGLLAYELITGHRAHRMESRTAAAVERVICDEEPRRPSTVVERAAETTLSAADSAEQIAERRATSPHRLRALLSGDVDAIVMQALRKEPERRYASVDEFIGDIERHLTGMPVAARNPTIGYRATRYARRHWVGVGATAIVITSLVGGLSLALWQARVASSEAARADQVKSFLVDLFEQADPDAAGGEELTVREVLESGAERIDTELADQPIVRAELLDAVGRILFQLGSYETAEKPLADALALQRQHLPNDLLAIGKSQLSLADLLREIGRYEEAELLLREALDQLGRRVGEQSLEVVRAKNTLGLLLAEIGEYDASEAVLREALATRRSLNLDDDAQVAGIVRNLALCLKWKGDLPAAEEPHFEALEIFRRVYEGDHTKTAWAAENLAVLYGMQGRYAESLPLHEEALGMLTRLLGEEHPDIALITNNFAKTFMLDARFEVAEPLYRRALTLNRKLFGEESSRFATNLSNLALVLTERQQHDEAIAFQKRALEIRRSSLGSEHPYTALSVHYLAVALDRSGRPDLARPHHQRVLEVCHELWDESSPFLAMVLFGAGQHALLENRAIDAEPLLREALEIRSRTLVPDHWETAAARALLGAALARSGHREEGRTLLREGLEILSARRPEGDWHRSYAENEFAHFKTDHNRAR